MTSKTMTLAERLEDIAQDLTFMKDRNTIREAIAKLAAPEAPRQSEPVAWLVQWNSTIPGITGHREVVLSQPFFDQAGATVTPLSPDHSGGAGEVVLPEGWKAVPIEPTELMIRRGDQNYSWSVAKIYKAMIEDAPSLDKVKELNQ